MMKNPLMALVTFILGIFLGYFLGLDGADVSPQPDVTSSIEHRTDVQNDSGHESEIRRFMQRLSESEDKIQELMALNDSLSAMMDGQKNQMAAFLSKPSVQNKINNMSDAELAEKLALMFSAEDLAGVENKKDMAKRLAEVALGGEEDFSSVSASIAVTKTRQHTEYGEQYLNINQYDFLYAHLTGSENLHRVLVKWQDLSSGKIITIRRFGFAPDATSYTVSLRPNGGWQKGDYQVNLYHVDSGLTPLATTTYTIAAIEAEEPPASNTVPPEPVEGVSARKTRTKQPSLLDLF